jgi:hypothetical protein
MGRWNGRRRRRPQAPARAGDRPVIPDTQGSAHALRRRRNTPRAGASARPPHREGACRMQVYHNAIYLLCLLTSLICTGLLYRGYRRYHIALLFWSMLCFVFLSLNNLLLYVDVALLPDISLRLLRLGTNLTAVTLLLYGFLWESE